MSEIVTGQPRVRRNEWHHLRIPEIGAWEPSLSVSIVIPAYDAGQLLPLVLAGLAAQTYPSHLMEVLVADDGPGALALPDVRPERTRVIDVAGSTGGWGRANACHAAALTAAGDVLHWLDADMLVERDEVEAQMRWHHLIDHAVVLGHKWFVDPARALAVAPGEVRNLVASGRVDDLFAGQEWVAHEWVEEIFARTDDLRQAGPFALRTHTGATASVSRGLYLDSGGMDPRLRLGEDIALGHRLAEAGAVFVPDRAARSWHLGASHVMSRREQVNDYNDPFLADRASVLRPKRHPGRSYRSPYLEVVLDTRGHDHAAVAATVDAVLASSLHDLVVTLLGEWSSLSDERGAVLDDAELSARLVHATYAGDAQVSLVQEIAPGRPSSAFRLILPGAGWAPGPAALERLLLHLEHTHDGVREVVMPDGSRARCERTAAYARARRVARPGESLDEIVAVVWGWAEMSADLAGFGPSVEVRPRHYPRTGGPPVSSEAAWSRIERIRGRQGARGRGAKAGPRHD